MQLMQRPGICFPVEFQRMRAMTFDSSVIRLDRQHSRSTDGCFVTIAAKIVIAKGTVCCSKRTLRGSRSIARSKLRNACFLITTRAATLNVTLEFE